MADDLYVGAVVPNGIGHVAASLLRIVVLDETDAAAADERILLQGALQQHGQLVGAVEVFLYQRDEVVGVGTDVGSDKADVG